MKHVQSVDQLMLEFSKSLKFTSSFETEKIPAKWLAPALGVRKMNCDAAFKDGKAALAIVVWDEDGLFVVARTKLLSLSSALEAEIKAIEWAIQCVLTNQ